MSLKDNCIHLIESDTNVPINNYPVRVIWCGAANWLQMSRYQ
jgi:hypothetical protein